MQTLAKRTAEGRLFLLACNSSADPARPRWSNLPAGTAALEVVSDRGCVAPAAPAAGSLPPFPDSTCSSRSAAAGGRALAVEGGSAADDFGPYDVVVYEAVAAGAAAL